MPTMRGKGKIVRGHINEKLHTSLANSGRAAGTGISYDRYDEESGYRPQPIYRGRVTLPSDGLTDAELAALNGDLRVYKAEGKPKSPCIACAQRWTGCSRNCDEFLLFQHNLKAYKKERETSK